MKVLAFNLFMHSGCYLERSVRHNSITFIAYEYSLVY
jgi:hypothetical protein